MRNKTIYIFSGGERSISPDVLTALERLLPINFIQGGNDQAIEHGAIAFEPTPEQLQICLRSAKPAFVFCADFLEITPDKSAKVIAFSESDSLDTRLRGRQLAHEQIAHTCHISEVNGDVVLATIGGRSIWTKRQNAGSCFDIVAYPLPNITKDRQVLDFIHGGNFIQLVPLIHFLREIIGQDSWENPRLQACFMFDDPNLHWTSYGFLHFASLASSAKEHNYHVSFATVPLDAWWTSRKAAELFRTAPGQLSLLIHGNDHIHQELSKPLCFDEHIRVYSQALRRISKMERRSGVSVGRAMAPPHGASGRGTMSALLSVGFEGACISPWSLRNWAAGRNWSPSFGLEIAERLEEDFPVLPRFRLSADCHSQIVISAFLNRPIIPVGHHDSVCNGIELLEVIADQINSLGAVVWRSPQDILREHFQRMTEGSTLIVRPYSARFSIVVPEGINAFRISPPPNAFRSKDWFYNIATLRRGKRTSTVLAVGDSLEIQPFDRLEVVHAGFGTIDPYDVPRPKVSIWPISRRILCEARDRVGPVLRRFRSNTN